MPAFVSTLGSSTATSYISVAQADDYYLGSMLEAKWSALTTAQKETALMAATRNLEMLQYVGKRCTPSTNNDDLEQALQWPRSKATCRDIEAKCDMLPKEIIEATSYLALELHTTPPTVGTVESGTLGAVKRQQLGELSQEFYDVKEGSSTKVDASAPLILQKYPQLVDILGCWSDTSTGAGKVALRVRS